LPLPISGSIGSGELGKRAEQCVAPAEHGARADDRSPWKRLPNYQFAATSSTDVKGPRIGIGADTGDKHEARDASGDCLPR
jgi:hypothetical protein